MDAELLKCQRTHEALGNRFVQSRRLLNMMSYLNQSGCRDSEFVEYKRRCGNKLAFLSENKIIPKQNIAAFGLDSCNLSLYHQCVMTGEREMVPSEFKRNVEDWKRVVLELDTENEQAAICRIHECFCKLAGFISYPKRALDEMLADFVCPLCILTDAYSDIGWTDYVCPKPAGETRSLSSSVSKRGEDKKLPAGACEHIMTIRTTRYDRLFE